MADLRSVRIEKGESNGAVDRIEILVEVEGRRHPAEDGRQQQKAQRGNGNEGYDNREQRTQKAASLRHPVAESLQIFLVMVARHWPGSSPKFAAVSRLERLHNTVQPATHVK